MAKQRKSSASDQPSIDVRIGDLTERVFGRLQAWAKMALLVTGGLGLLTFALGLTAAKSLREFPLSAVFLIIVAIPAIAALIIGRRAKAIHRSIDDIQADIRTAVKDPEVRDLFDNFLDGDSSDDGRAGVAQLARGALGVRKVVRSRRDTLVHLAAAIRSMVASPGLLVTITAGMAMLAMTSVIFVLIAIF